MLDLDDPLPLARALIRCPSVTPTDAGAQDVLIGALQQLGFTCRSLSFGEQPPIRNLYARLGTDGPVFCYAGHTDVVPVGTCWSRDPFAADVVDSVLYGRGAVDMKSAITCFVSAVARLLKERRPAGSISLLITGDEEGDAVNGSKKVLEWMEEHGERIDVCMVGEPTSARSIGDTIKIGRRGSLNGHILVEGRQGHVAYPHLADNPAPHLVKLLGALSTMTLDHGTEHFQPSNLAITSIVCESGASNLTPKSARASFNIRFNDLHAGKALAARLRTVLSAAVGGNSLKYDLKLTINGEAFLTTPGPLSGLLSGAVGDVTGAVPTLSTGGGTSDARFIKNYAPVIECGLVGASMHQADEHCPLQDLETLTQIYRLVVSRFFAGDGEQPLQSYAAPS